MERADKILEEIVERCGRMGVYERRSVSDKYCELVFYNKEIDEWKKTFTDILGPAAKPAGAKPAREDIRLTKDHGGVHDDQTLFKKEHDEVTVIAMFWPWQDHAHTTLKIALLKK
ncbi:MAG: hypothetical protein KAS86_03315 [Candidatus Omnitrophica bacterium]|nr:hypothetical protein [Candidatus Omnitrophota bacterium]